MYYCSLCEYATKFQSYLSRHMHVHSDTRAYTCNSCGSSFKTHSAYLLHMRERHGGQDRYTCQICAAEFAQQRTLDRHMLCHKDEKAFACSLCGYTCKRRQDLVCHVAAMHDPAKIGRKRHEELVARLFCSLRVSFTREFTIRVRTFGSRTSARIDFHINMPWGWLLFEVDEMAHNKYSISEECMRMAAIANHLKQNSPGMKLHIVRYNSHAFKQDGVVCKPSQEERVESIKANLAYVPDSDFVITYLFYRSANGRPAVTLDAEYTLQHYVRTPHTAISM